MSSLLFIHGSLSSGRTWRRHQAYLKGHLSLAPDLLGAGENPPITLQGGWTLESELQALEALYDKLPGPITLIAHSFGGALALFLAARQPGRISKVIIHEPATFPLLTIPEDWALLATQADTRLYLDESKAGTIEWLSGIVDFWSGPGTWDSLGEARQQEAVRRGEKAFLEVRFGIGEGVPPETLREVKAPVYLSVGESGPPSEHRVVETLTHRLPRAQMMVVPGGHNAPLTHFEPWIAQVRAWLAVDKDSGALRRPGQ